jgi:hypothetical protein
VYAAEPVPSLELDAVHKPFNLEFRVVYRLQSALQMGVLALFQVVQAAKKKKKRKRKKKKEQYHEPNEVS